MLKPALIILIIATWCRSAFAQSVFDDLKVYEARFDSVHKTSIIPDSIFKMSIDLLLLRPTINTIETGKKVGYEIWWPSPYTDGTLSLTITKRQIYLRSGHNNPNPNYLYWFVNITDEQYKIIESKIRADKTLFKKGASEYSCYIRLYYTRFKPEKSIPKIWTKDTEAQSDKDWRDKKYINTDNLISFFDNGLTVNKIIPFVSKEDFDKNEPVRIVFSEEDYDGQIKLAVPPKQ